MSNEQIAETARAIKQSFRLYMNGVTSQSMRQKGAAYNINWGASLQHLREMAAGYRPDRRLAEELWKNDVRECKLMAILLMPPADMDMETACEWMGQAHNPELAELAAMQLFPSMPQALPLADRLLGEVRGLCQLSGVHLVTRLVMRGAVTSRQAYGRYGKAIARMSETSQGTLRHAASNCMLRMDPSDE